MPITRRPLRIAPSILASDFARLGEECQAVLDAGADWLHVDVMDGHYVPNITIGLPVVKSLRAALPDAFLDVHIMIDNPDVMGPRFVDAGADLVCFHPEASRHPHSTIQRIHDLGGKAGIAINPGTPLSCLDYLADDLDLILIMSVNPGFGGQSFIGNTLPKLHDLQDKLTAMEVDIDVQVDGGVRAENAAAIRRAGADVLVAGSAIFKQQDYAEAIAAIRHQASLVDTV